MPADIESKMPLTTFAVKDPGLYVVRRPSPIAIEIGVVRPYAVQSNQGSQLDLLKGIADILITIG